MKPPLSAHFEISNFCMTASFTLLPLSWMNVVVPFLGKDANGVLSAICVLVVLKRRSCACQEGTERSEGHHEVTRNGVKRSLQA